MNQYLPKYVLLIDILFLVMVNFIECIYNRYLEKDEAGLVRSTFTEVYNLAVGRSGDEAAELGLQSISLSLSFSLSLSLFLFASVSFYLSLTLS